MFVRNIAGIILVIGLFFVAGCISTKSGSKTPNVFSPLQWTKKEQPEGATRTTMEQVLRQDRVTTLR